MKNDDSIIMNPKELRQCAQELLNEKRKNLHISSSSEELQALLQEVQVHQIELELQNEELRRVQVELQESRDKFADLYDFAPIGYLSLDRNGTISHINLTGTKLLKTERNKVINRRFQIFLPYNSLLEYDQFITKAFDSKIQVSLEIQLLVDRALGPHVRLEAFVFEESLECRVAMIDITERVKAEDILRKNLTLTTSLAKLYAPLTMPDATLETSAKVILKEVMELTDSNYGYVGTINEHGDLSSHIISNMMHDCNVFNRDNSLIFKADGGGFFSGLWGHSLNTKKSFFTNNAAKHPASMGIPDGHVKLINLISVPVMLGDIIVGQITLANKPTNYTQDDIEIVESFASNFALAVQRMKNKKALVASKSLLERILLGIKAGIIVIDQETQKIESIDNIALNMLRGTTEDYVGSNLNILEGITLDGEYVPFCSSEKDMKGSSDIRVSRQDGTMLPILKIVLEDVIDGNNKFIGIIFDITDRKEMERSLALAQKLESIGQLSAGVAHEINTPSQYIGSNLKFLSEAMASISLFLQEYKEIFNVFSKTGLDSTVLDKLQSQWENSEIDYLIEELPIALSQSAEGIEQISSIVNALKRFSHPGSDSRILSDINDALKTTSIISRNEWKYHADVVFDFEEEVFMVSCDINSINQVFLNVIINATHALKQKYGNSEQKGTITIQTRHVDNWAEIAINDTGAGIPANILPRIFDPYFTTKKMGHGTGQGLALSHSIIVDKHNGKIEFHSEEGVGTTCLIRLPL